MSTTTKQVRKTLAEAMKRCEAGELSADDGKSLIGLANQISHSMAVEVKVLTMNHKLGHNTDKFGDLSIE